MDNYIYQVNIKYFEKNLCVMLSEKHKRMEYSGSQERKPDFIQWKQRVYNRWLFQYAPEKKCIQFENWINRSRWAEIAQMGER